MRSLPYLLLLILLFFSFTFFFTFVSARPIPDAHRDEPQELPPETAQANSTWGAFHRLIDLQRGSRVKELSGLKSYLARFGYLSEADHVSLSAAAAAAAAADEDAFDARLESAVRRYQANLGLPPTGRLDSATVAQLMTPRCGVPDEPVRRLSNQTANLPVRYAFFSGHPRWKGGPEPLTLKYAVSPTHTVDYLSREDVAAVLRRSFDRWARVIPVKFEEVEDYDGADVKVGFYSGEHGDGEPFDGKLGILAHAFSPESGRLHLDAAERWSVDFDKERAKAAIDLESVATHEIGHVLGLGHSTVKEAVMYPSLHPRRRKTELRVDDVVGVQSLYGSNPDFRMSELLEEETSSAGDGGAASVDDWIRILVLAVILTLMV